MTKAAFVNYYFPDYALEEELLQKVGIDAEFHMNIPHLEILPRIKDADALVVQLEKVPGEWFPHMPHLKVIARSGVGLDSIDVEAATKFHIPVINVPDYCMEEVAVHACSMILATHRKLLTSFNLVKSDNWRAMNELIPIHSLSTLTLGLIGMGRIGAEVIARMRSFGCRMIVSDPFLSEDHVPSGVELLPLEQLLEQSDIITVHCPLTEKTKYILNGEAFAKMEKSPIIVNVSRGGIIHEGDLVKALDEGKVSFAALDVLEKEPADPDGKLVRHPKVMMTNHLAWYSEESAIRLRTLTITRMIDYLQGRPVPTIVNQKQLLSQ